MIEKKTTKPEESTTLEVYRVVGVCPYCGHRVVVLMDEYGNDREDYEQCEHSDGWTVEGTIDLHGYDAVTFLWADDISDIVPQPPTSSDV